MGRSAHFTCRAEDPCLIGVVRRHKRPLRIEFRTRAACQERSFELTEKVLHTGYSRTERVLPNYCKPPCRTLPVTPITLPFERAKGRARQLCLEHTHRMGESCTPLSRDRVKVSCWGQWLAVRRLPD